MLDNVGAKISARIGAVAGTIGAAAICLSVLGAATADAQGLNASRPAVSRPSDWSPQKAQAYLDERQQKWFDFAKARRGEGTTQTSCVSCHTSATYAVARSSLRTLGGESRPVDLEKKLFDQISQRATHWDRLDTPAYGLAYDFNDARRQQSRGTEAVLNAWLLSERDRLAGRTAPAADTLLAFTSLWKTQLTSGDRAGAWDWLDFDYQPWESANGVYYGATLAAAAVGNWPEYLAAPGNSARDAGLSRLRRYLRDRSLKQNLFNRAWLLFAGTRMTTLLSHEQKSQIANDLISRQQPDGGWTLSGFGKFRRVDNTPIPTESDALATAMTLYIVQQAGVESSQPNVANGLRWLKAHQQSDGSWIGHSLNRQRDAQATVGKFMNDAATAYAVLALTSAAR